VVLTTAYQSERTAAWQKFVSVASLATVFAYCLVAGVALLAGRQQGRKGVPLLKAVLGWFPPLIFILLALVVTVWRRHSNSVLTRIGELLKDLEYLLSMDAGVPAAVWLSSGGIALFGLSVAVGHLRARSFWRLVGVGGVLVGAALLISYTPPDQWKEPIGYFTRTLFVLPALVGAFIHRGHYPRIALRGLACPIIRWPSERPWYAGEPATVCSAALVVVLALLVFVPPNFFEAQLGMQRTVLCLEQATGSVLWETPVFTAPTERKHTQSSHASPTVAMDGQHIIASFGVGVACLDHDGRVLWRKWDSGYLENSRYGAAGSPLLVEGVAIVIQEAEDSANRPTWIAAFDKTDGRIAWRIESEIVSGSYTTPLLFPCGDREQLIVASTGDLVAFDCRSGECLWSDDIPTSQLVASPVRSGDILCLGGGTWGLRRTLAIRISETAGEITRRTLWSSTIHPPGDCSPVVYEGKLFTLSDNGWMTCFDVSVGTVLWSERIGRGLYMSSLVAGDGKVYATNTKGITTVVAAADEFAVLATNDLDGRCYATPAIADGCLYLRVGSYLYAVAR
jgi:hypothetical protein